MATKTTASTTAAGSMAKKAQTEKNTTADVMSETVKLVYIGPNLPKAMLQCNKIFEGTTEEIDRELASVIEKFPLVKKMLVPISELSEKKYKVRTAGNIYNKYYADLKAAALAYLDKGGTRNE